MPLSLRCLKLKIPLDKVLVRLRDTRNLTRIPQNGLLNGTKWHPLRKRIPLSHDATAMTPPSLPKTRAERIHQRAWARRQGRSRTEERFRSNDRRRVEEAELSEKQKKRACCWRVNCVVFTGGCSMLVRSRDSFERKNCMKRQSANWMLMTPLGKPIGNCGRFWETKSRIRLEDSVSTWKKSFMRDRMG
jgi:hypothetical protein